MGYWSESIYGNDRAMDLLAEINYLLKAKKKSALDIIHKYLEEECDEDELLVLADFELFAFGSISHTSNVIDVIDKMVENTDTWDNPQKRKDELLKFKNKIVNNKNSTNLNRSNKELLDWVSEKRKLDIFNTFNL